MQKSNALLWEVEYQLSMNGSSNFAVHYVLIKKLYALQLLAKDPALERFKSYRKSASSIRRIGDYLTIVVVAGTNPCF